MGFPFSSKGVNLEGPPPAPAGVYSLEIIEATDIDKEGLPLLSKKSGYPMVKCKLRIIDGEKKWPTFNHWVVFIPKGEPGEGMSIHFLKRIGEPWQDDFDVTPENWAGKTFRAMLKAEKDNQGIMRNSIQWLAEEKNEDEIPF